MVMKNWAKVLEELKTEKKFWELGRSPFQLLSVFFRPELVKVWILFVSVYSKLPRNAKNTPNEVVNRRFDVDRPRGGCLSRSFLP